MKDITIIIPEGGGAVPELWEALEAAAIEVEAAISFSREHHRVIHIVVADTGAQEAADVLHITQPRVSALLKGKIDEFRLDTLVDLAHRLGLHVSINVAA